MSAPAPTILPPSPQSSRQKHSRTPTDTAQSNVRPRSPPPAEGSSANHEAKVRLIALFAPLRTPDAALPSAGTDRVRRASCEVSVVTRVGDYEGAGDGCAGFQRRAWTAAHCYQGQEGSSIHVRNDESISPRAVDPVFEFSKIRQALSLLESHVVYIQRAAGPSTSVLPVPRSSSYGLPMSTSSASSVSAKQEIIDTEIDQDVPGVNGRSDQGGFYAGPTSAVSHLTVANDGASEDSEATLHDAVPWDTRPGYEDDHDLLAELPHASIVDGLVEFYFEYCTWVYRHVNQRAFTDAWARYKSGAGADRIVLATACMVMAVALHYLPADHELLRGLPPDIEELGSRFYNIMRVALQRRQAESRAYSLELVELLLVRCHYLTLSKIDSEEIWCVKGEVVMVATAMGLFRDPGKRKMSLEAMERRRWAWWHVILLERWQAFMFGRPLAIASHHFDTQLPSYVDPDLDPTGRLYDANIALFRLAYILGDIMDDAVSLRPVSYDSVIAKDQLLHNWWETFPPELDIDDYNLVRSLASSETPIRRLAVQSIIIRSAFLHIRFTLHRPYASLARDSPKMSFSLDTAVSAADKLIALSASAHPELQRHAALAVPGHMNWGPLHNFSAAMFFSFQLINDPDQPGARMFRSNVVRAVHTLERCSGMPVADKALAILRALSPLYAEVYLTDKPEVREHKKASILPRVRTLQFPYHDSPNVPFGSPESPRNGTLSPGQSSGSPAAVITTPTPPKPPMNLPPAGPMQQHQQAPPMMALQPPPEPGPSRSQSVMEKHESTLPSLRWAPPAYAPDHHAAHHAHGHYAASNGKVAQQQAHPQTHHAPLPPVSSHGVWHPPQPAMPLPTPPQGQQGPPVPQRLSQHPMPMAAYQQQQQQQQQQQPPPHMMMGDVFMDGGPPGPYGAGEGALWGATSGFVQNEWDQILDDLQRHDGM
ncbi:hypothetical protein BV25DRAFT_1990699 [Artomyces pyxidatus]|uniref:Uncharacterized protein n=1 Tax=Artomyces pyxidatus TaxID=48021 RepID=A0ACB8T4W5_9AGAM|nr:hypothetical protein BV25DRAFT_1990699 [Artomyces pyxidatus]